MNLQTVMLGEPGAEKIQGGRFAGFQVEDVDRGEIEFA